MNPAIKTTSKTGATKLTFTLSGVDKSFANSIRRTILTDIPVIVCRVSPNSANKCVITVNDTDQNNQIVSQRLSYIPIHKKPATSVTTAGNADEFTYQNYLLEIDVENNTNVPLEVTSGDIKIKHKTTGKYLSKEATAELYPPNEITGDYIGFVMLGPKVADGLPNKAIKLTCEFDVGTAGENSGFATGNVSYNNTIDESAAESALVKEKQKWKDEGMTADRIEFQAKNWRLLEQFRIFKPNSFDFWVTSVGTYTNVELVTSACDIMIARLMKVERSIDEGLLEIMTADCTMQNSYDVILPGDYTIGCPLEYSMYHKFYERGGMLTFISYNKRHPHDKFGVIRLAYAEPVETSTIFGHIKEAITDAIQVFNGILSGFGGRRSSAAAMA